MDFQDVVRTRRMVRAFTDRPVPRDVVARILGNARRGPSSGFAQGFEFLVFDGPEQTARFWGYLRSRGEDDSDELPVMAAPLIVVPVANADAYVRRYLEPDKVHVGRTSADDWPAPYWFTDTAFAAMLILLTAVDAGLGAYYFSLGPTSREIPGFKTAFGIPEPFHPIGAIAIGYPAPDRPSPSLRRGRRPPEDVLHFGEW
ncbi:MAG TPA: nitroreductase family protein [Chloroflexota bacterium]|nr:nitroreductase family protein [Chloroflexota bacterium]